MSDRPSPAWTRSRAVAALRRVLDGAPAGPVRAEARLALTWLDGRMAHLERAVRAEDDTQEIPTP